VINANTSRRRTDDSVGLSRLQNSFPYISHRIASAQHVREQKKRSVAFNDSYWQAVLAAHNFRPEIGLYDSISRQHP
jgi:hypothetical protein